jgi:magnesium-transporting ATPase (P-type)
MKTFGGVNGLILGLESDAKMGISASSVTKRKNLYGSNAFPPPQIKGLCELIMENFNDPINVILCGAAVVSIVIGIIREGFPDGLTEGVSIMIALAIIFVVNSGNNYKAERQLASMMMKCEASKIPVFRGSTEPTMISNDDLVVGDIFAFANGKKIPADAVMISGD